MQIERINQFDATAFKYLYDNYYKALVAYACSVTGLDYVSEDIVQELFSNLLERKTRFLTLSALKAYMYNSVHNASLDYLKHRNVKAAYQRSVAEGAKIFNLTVQGGEDLWDEEVYRLLFNAVDALPLRQREVFLLVIEGKKNSEIAETLGISLESVKTHRKRGMAFLRKRLGAGSLIYLILMQAVASSVQDGF